MEKTQQITLMISKVLIFHLKTQFRNTKSNQIVSKYSDTLLLSSFRISSLTWNQFWNQTCTKDYFLNILKATESISYIKREADQKHNDSLIGWYIVSEIIINE